MKRKAVIAISLALIMLLTVAAPVSAAKLGTARGKLVPAEGISAGGSYLFETTEYTDFYYLSSTIKAKKLTPDSYYFVGWLAYKDGLYQHKVFRGVLADSKGSFKETISTEITSYLKNENWTFKAFVTGDKDEPYDLYDLLGSEEAFSFP